MSKSSWRKDFKRDVHQYVSRGAGRSRGALLLYPGLWVLLQYRIAHHYRRYRVLRPLLAAWRLLMEMTTGACIPSEAQIGPGLHISHPAGIVISTQAVIGNDCLITHGVTIGVAGKGPNRGVPRIGDRVYMGPHAVIVGSIVIGDDTMIGANCVVSRDIPAGSRVRPAPVCIATDETDQAH